MASNGISWVGNIYQKFETMCLEVEEVMYEQLECVIPTRIEDELHYLRRNFIDKTFKHVFHTKDTVKYVENQVQKVGVSVKKFYAEVMQDLLPPSDGDPVKSPGNLSLNHCDSDLDIKKKPKLSMLDGKSYDKRDAEDDVVSDLTKVEGNQLSLRNPTVLVESTCSTPSSTKSKIGIQRRTIGIKRISQNSRPAKVSSTVTSSSEHVSRKLVHDRNVESESDIAVRLPEEAANDNAVTSSAAFKSSSDSTTPATSVRPEDDESVSTSPASGNTLSDEFLRPRTKSIVCTFPTSDDVVLAESSSLMKNDSGCTSHERLKMNNQECVSPASSEVESAESRSQNKYNSGVSSAAAATSSTDTARTHSFLSECTSMNRNLLSKAQSSIRNKDACQVDSVKEAFLMPNDDVVEGFVMPDEGLSVHDSSFQLLSSHSDLCNVEQADDFDMEVIENYQVAERNTQTFEPAGKSGLEETCVFVEGDELLLAHEIKKHKSYKKKIREALSSKLRSPRKQDRFLSQSKELGEHGNSSALHTRMVGSDKGKLRAHEPLESDWELL